MIPFTLVLISILSFAACAEPSEKPSETLRVNGDFNSKGPADAIKIDQENSATIDTEPGSPEAVASSAQYQNLLNTSFQVEGIPKGASDIYNFEFKIKADPSITYFSYKIGTPDDCKLGAGHQVEPISSTIKISVDTLPDGPVAICFLKYHETDKLWLNAEDSIVETWTKIAFVRSIKSEFQEFDASCRKNITTVAEVKFSGSSGTYVWSRDPKSQGCNQPKTQGEDKLSITSSNSTEIKGFWLYNGENVSGWYAFKWKTAERTSFEGSYGYGDPNLEPSGPWNSTAP